jgi:hypothetical protein
MQVQVKRDHNLKQEDIVVVLSNSSKDEAGEHYIKNQPEIQQTLVYGIQAPLIKLNNVVVDFSDVIDFSLKSTSVLPELSVVVRDRYNLSATLDTPGVDNTLRLQILPKFDGKYKKINLTFYVTDIRFDKGFMTIRANYKIPKFTNSRIKSFGVTNTYDLFDKVSTESDLGFATNIEPNDNDKRYVYCDNKSYNELISREIRRSGNDLEIYDYWVDWWNNLVLVDIYERYNTIEPEDKLKLWVAGQNNEVTEGSKIEPQEVPAVLNNNPAIQASELYVESYNITNKAGSQVWLGTDRVYSTYECPSYEYRDYLIQDKDVHKDIYEKYEYLGEVYGDYNYLLSEKKRDGFLQKIRTHETIEVNLKTPLLGIMRGNKINFTWYINNSYQDTIKQNMQDNSQINVVQTNPIIDDSSVESKSNDGSFEIDKSISGQYLITGCEIKFSNKKWQYKVTLSRPYSQKPKIINDNDE